MNRSRPAWYVYFAVLALLWNLMGVAAFFAQVFMTESMLAQLPAAERALYESFPLWALLAFALAVGGGALGCLALILRKSAAFWILLASLIGILIQLVHSISSGAFAHYGPGALIMPAMVVLVSVALVWLARLGNQRGWLS